MQSDNYCLYMAKKVYITPIGCHDSSRTKPADKHRRLIELFPVICRLQFVGMDILRPLLKILYSIQFEMVMVDGYSRKMGYITTPKKTKSDILPFFADNCGILHDVSMHVLIDTWTLFVSFWECYDRLGGSICRLKRTPQQTDEQAKQIVKTIFARPRPNVAEHW